MILHLFNYDEKFVVPYISFVNKNFDKKQHAFLIVGEAKIIEIIENNVEQIESYRKHIAKIVGLLNSYDKVIIHSLNNTDLSKILFFQPWLLKRCYWVVWGADLYYYRDRKKSFKSHVHEFFRRHVIRNIGGLITHVKGDYELAKKWYGVSGRYYYSFMYPSNLYHEYDLPELDKSDKIYIQVGNSADPSNNHIEIFEKLKNFKNKNIEILCPLSYGDIKYREYVIKEGKKFFGIKFKPIIEFLPFDEYLKLLAQIDVAIFNHNRQQALGNIITLLGLGKKIYIRDDITTWNFCLDHKLKIFKTNYVLNDLLYDAKTLNTENINNIKNIFSIENLYNDWKEIFNA